MRQLSRPLAIALAIAPLSTPTAHAANGMRPRTPADFGDVPCLQTATVGDVLHLEYTVPYDDTELTPEELPDSREHQFFAFSQTQFDFLPPAFITQADFDRADQNGDITRVFGPDDILETSTSWPAGTWVRITEDDARVPITMAQAAMGVDWDTAGVDPGTWLVYAYTWEPENNLWSRREGAIRLEAPGEPASAGPSLFIEKFASPLATRGEPLAIPGCIEAPDGARLTASWGDVVGNDEPTWIPFAEDVEVESGPLDLDFVAPNEASDSVRLRFEITDPDGRTHVAYALNILAVTGDPVDPPEEGCRCGHRPPPPSALLLGLCALGLRRRRRG